MVLDPALVLGVRRYLQDLEEKMFERLNKGEQEHAGQWKEMSIAQLHVETEEAFIDMLCYDMFIEIRERNEKD